MMSIGKLKNQMQDDANNNLCQANVTEVPNNEKTLNTDQAERSAIEITRNDFVGPPAHVPPVHDKKCEAAKDGKCSGEIKTYGHPFFNCLLAGEHHVFCRYHYDNATFCPVHPTFNRVL